jgi:hypothetical protein
MQKSVPEKKINLSVTGSSPEKVKYEEAMKSIKTKNALLLYREIRFL